ncbi:MAG: DUF1361 domain-containing protein [Bacteroidetes bacterium]|nr:DUF1361 domain-containing protein [Bacteroidota bacterium]
MWNLFLAYIPFGISTLMKLKERDIEPFQFWLIFPFWILFFPNAPYILTDLFHLMPRGNTPEWFDLFLLLSFSITGLLLGLFSLKHMHQFVIRFHSNGTGLLFVFCTLTLGSFGVYLGRFERFNSWDIIRSPLELFHDIGSRILYPTNHIGTWGMTIALSILIGILYLLIGELENKGVKN